MRTEDALTHLKVTSLNWAHGAESDEKHLGSCSWYPSRELNWRPPEYEVEVLLSPSRSYFCAGCCPVRDFRF